VAIYRVYLEQGLDMRWRAWMTDRYLGIWLDRQAYYRIDQTKTADNADQRIAEDLRSLTRGTLSLSLGLMSSIVTLISFVGILWSVSGPLAFVFAGQQWTLHGYMVWFALAYAAIGSALVWWIGRSLVGLNFDQQKFEADFRFGLVRLRENAESVALYRGEAQERQQLAKRFDRIRGNWWNIMRTTKRLNVASTFYAQFANIFPFLVGAPRYFSGALQLGGLMQISSAFGQVQESLSWFINAFGSSGEGSLPAWKASVNRLAGFHAAVMGAATKASGIRVDRNNVGAILMNDLALHLPGGEPLMAAFSADLRSGQRVLLSGPSGCGKSTLFRALAGIWPYGEGSIEIPSKTQLMFVPQKSYLPVGSLRAALAYPASEQAYRDLAIRHYLAQCRLAHLCDRLDETENWSQRLSPGEQQRLAFVRLLLARPDVIFLDESTSALDAATEEALYELMLQELPESTVMSIAHRETVAKFHQAHWQFVRMQNGQHTIHLDQSVAPDLVVADLLAKAIAG
jgi:putative ATP-binding cassette transporter